MGSTLIILQHFVTEPILTVKYAYQLFKHGISHVRQPRTAERILTDADGVYNNTMSYPKIKQAFILLLI
jgi:hypothetical protein